MYTKVLIFFLVCLYSNTYMYEEDAFSFLKGTVKYKNTIPFREKNYDQI